MSEPAISARNLSKCYRLGTISRHTLVEEVEHWWHRLRGRDPRHYMGKIGRLPGETVKAEHECDDSETFWALRDVSFDVQPGEVVGIIGRNGAGKSTLLKLLTRITEPTSGEAFINGRVRSLLEVGTGFHPEMTGRENIHMNGAILGMKRAEIAAKFNDIVSFAELGQFIDTPVKRYSSGMYVRLAFAVAAYLDPEILLVDEVLAVGDTEFQKKCIGKMATFAETGRTVVFVSHNMVAVQQLCQRGLILTNGKLSFVGDVSEAVHRYVNDVRVLAKTPLSERRDRKGNGRLRFTRVAFFDKQGSELKQVLSGQDLIIRFYYRSDFADKNVQVLAAFNVASSRGYLLTNLNSVDSGSSLLDVHADGYFECRWPTFSLRSDTYSCALFCSINGEIADWVDNAFDLPVEDGDFYHTGKIVHRQQGDVLIAHQWSTGGN